MTLVDPRLYILGGLALLLVLLLGYILVALGHYRRAVKAAREAAAAAAAENAARRPVPLTPPVSVPRAESSASLPFGIETHSSVLTEPLRTGNWKPRELEAFDVLEPPVQLVQAATVPVPSNPESPSALAPQPVVVQQDPNFEVVLLTLPAPPISEPEPEPAPVALPTVTVHAMLEALAAPKPVEPPAQQPVVVPSPLTGSALSSASSIALPISVPEPEPELGRADEYVLVAPVEIQFTLGESRVGVRAGSKTYAEFQRLAGILLGDVEEARQRPSL